MGVALAVASGVAHNIGVLLQKKVVNRIAGGRQDFFARLVRNPLWLAGFIIHMSLGTALFLLAQVRLGPALIPGLMAAGLVVLVVGSIWILKEQLGAAEITGTLLLIAAMILILEIPAKQMIRHRGSALAISSGLFYVLSNFWVGPFMGAVLRIFKGIFTFPMIALFAAGSAILVITNMVSRFSARSLDDNTRPCGRLQSVSEIQQLYLEDQKHVRRNDSRVSPLAVGQLRGNDQNPLLPPSHVD